MKKLLASMIKTARLSFLPLDLPDAAASAYQMSGEYQDSPFYQALINYSLTGDMRQDVVSIALTQLDYHEGDSDADMGGMNLSGGKNFAEYNRIWGKLDNDEGNGVSYGYAWCAAFISWCLRMSHVPQTIAPSEVTCRIMTEWYQAHAVYHPSTDGYLPLPGDIVMFQRGNGIANHVGFAVGVRNDTLYTVEGNSDNRVRMRSYSLSDSYILGYCVPAYTVKEGMSYNFPLTQEHIPANKAAAAESPCN